MNYKLIYDQIVARGKERVLEGYKECHHIVPRCLGGTDDPDNLVNLTPEEHYVCHQLLVKIHPGNDKLIYAAKMMSCNSNGLRPNNKLYRWLRIRHSQVHSARIKRNKTKEVTCPICSKVGRYPKSYVTKYCSRTCSGIAKKREKRIESTCQCCGKTFSVLKNSTNANRFCTNQCYWLSNKGKSWGRGLVSLTT